MQPRVRACRSGADFLSSQVPFGNESAKLATVMLIQLPVFEVSLNKRGRIWNWRVCTIAGDVVMRGSGISRPAATYRAYRALFLLLQSAPYQSIRLANARVHNPNR
jgi:hypothetical protein